jgi:prepilin-type N-terminal cleavage/methylation domain-containing protein
MTHGSFDMKPTKVFLIRTIGLSGSRTCRTFCNKGFTLIELIMVVVIIGVLSTLAIPMFSNYIIRTKNVKAMTEIRNLSSELSSYNLDKTYYPDVLTELRPGPFKDPWQRDYEYINIATHPGTELMDILNLPLNRDYDLFSKGVDGNYSRLGGNPFNLDDIVRSNDGAFVGLRP